MQGFWKCPRVPSTAQTPLSMWALLARNYGCKKERFCSDAHFMSVCFNGLPSPESPLRLDLKVSGTKYVFDGQLPLKQSQLAYVSLQKIFLKVNRLHFMSCFFSCLNTPLFSV